MTEEAPAPVSVNGWRLTLTHLSEEHGETEWLEIHAGTDGVAFASRFHGLAGAAKTRFVARHIVDTSSELYRDPLSY